MIQSHLLDWLAAGGTPAQLTERYAIHLKPHPVYRSLVQLTYDQIQTPLKDPVVGPMLQECRGLILSTNTNRIIARPFDKFFNEGEAGAAEIDWRTAEVQEKLDGTLIIAYFYFGAWHVATRGTPDAGGPVLGGSNMTFRDLFMQTWQAGGYQWPCNERFTLLFELTGPQNRIVIPHAAAGLTLLAVRDPGNGEYFDRYDLQRWAEHIGCPVVRSFPLATLADIQATFANLNPLEQEGYVVADAAGRRIKVKHPGYVALHHLKDRSTPKSFIEVIRQGETEELLAHFPFLAAEFEMLKARYDTLCAGVAAAFADLHPRCATQKDFALAVQAEYPAWSPILFALRAGKATSPQQFLAGCPLASAMRLIGVRDDVEEQPHAE